MNKEEIETLKTLLNKYFESEFKILRKAHELVYNDMSIEDEIPENLFLGCLYASSDYQTFMEGMKKTIMRHIFYTFILESEANRFEES